MKAIRVNQWGAPVEIEDLPQPTPNNDEVLVRVRAASINPFDGAVAAGYMQGMLSAPRTLGADLAGDVVAVGSDVTGLAPGDAVYALVAMRGGAFAEYAIAGMNQVARKPATLDYVQAAAVPLPALAAWQALFNVAQLQPGERVLIHGAGGAMGSVAVQLAKERGAYVIGTASANKEALLRELGIDQFINYETQRFEDHVQDVDVVIIATPAEGLLDRSYGVLKRGGRLVEAAFEQPSVEEAERRGISVYSLATQENADDLATIAALFDAGKLRLAVHSTYPLDEAQTALNAMWQPHRLGKIVLLMEPAD